MRVDGYWFDDEGALDLYVADFESRAELESLTRTDVDAAFKRVTSFFEASLSKRLHEELEITSPEYGLARQIGDRGGLIRRLNLILASERALSDRIQTLDDGQSAGVPTTYHVWDMSRLQRQRASRGHKEPLNLDLKQMFGMGIPCLPAHLGEDAYPSYLVVMPAEILADLYERYGGRLLEQNVRSFLQARAKVNQGIRATIRSEPQMFFAYNNGITATAQEVDVVQGRDGLEIVRIRDLQIVNGGQTTASLFHTRRNDKASLKRIFVQMKLSVIDSAESENVVPRISEYANTQNRVKAADFFSNYPFHIRMEDFAPPVGTRATRAQRETKWFTSGLGPVRRCAGEADPADQRRFKAESPKSQMFAKTDLAKFENVWDEHPRWVNLGAQKNFAQFAKRIGKEWSSSPNAADAFNEFYFRRAVARAIIFRATEKLVSEQPWYNGGYRANIVAYTIAVISEICRRESKSIDYGLIWNLQALSPSLISAIEDISAFVNQHLISPPQGISNISEWAKREACWTRIRRYRLARTARRLLR